MKLLRRLASLAVAASMALPLLAHAGEHSKKLAFDTTTTGVQIDQAVSQLPVLVRLHSGNFTFSEAKPDGSDLRFFATDNKTELKYYVERYDAANELAVVWVQMPRLAPNAKTDALWLHWGNSSANASGVNFGVNYPGDYCQNNPDLCSNLRCKGNLEARAERN